MRSSRRALRRLALASCLVGTFWLTFTGISHWLHRAQLGRPGFALDYVRVIDKRLPALARSYGTSVFRVAVLGDSTLVSYPAGRTLPERLEQRTAALVSGRPLVRVFDLAVPGSAPFDQLFTVGRLLRAKPDLGLLVLNLDHLSQAWRDAYSRPELGGFIEPGRLLDTLRLPLVWVGLSTDALLFRLAVVEAGGTQAWRELRLRQAWFGRARDHLRDALSGGAEERFEDAVGHRTWREVFTNDAMRHYREPALLLHYGAALRGVRADHPVLQAVGAWVRRLREAGVPALVVVGPVEVDDWRARGLLDDDGLARTIAAVRTVVEGAGGRFLDLHDALPSAAFRDAAGHLATDGPIDGPDRLAERLAPAVASAARRFVGLGD